MIGLSITTMGDFLLAVVFIYVMGILLSNAYITLTLRSANNLILMSFLLGVITVLLISGNALYLSISVLITMILIIYSIVSKVNRKIKKNETEESS